MKLFFFLSLLTCLPCAQAAEPSYLERSQEILQDWKSFSSNMDITSNTLPHEVKALRKQLAQARDRLDIYAYAYSPKGRDLWQEIRQTLDTGYETMGAFKDLFDMQGSLSPEEAVYDSEEVNKARIPLLEWQKDFRKNEALYLQFLSQPEAEIQKRKKKKLSRFFWGAVKEEPSEKYSGAANLQMLASALMKEALTDYKEVLKLDNPAKNYDNAEEFHNFRKRTRSISKLLEYYSDLFTQVSEQDSAMLKELQSRYGDINDKIVTSHHLEDKGKKREAKQLQSEAKDEWDELLNWQEEQKILDLLEKLKEILP